MKICVLGSGALGSTFGGLLTEAGFEVYLIARWEEHVHAMNTEGLKIVEGSSERVVKVRATTDCAEAGPADLVIFLVKSFDTKEAIEKAQALIGPQTMVLSFQNGLGNEEILAEVVGPERVIGGKTYVGGVLVGPGHVIAGTKGKYTHIGELDGTTTERVSAIADQLIFTAIQQNQPAEWMFNNVQWFRHAIKDAWEYLTSDTEEIEIEF